MAAQFDAQRAVRMDAEQLNEYMQELFSWSKDMQRKERAKVKPAAPTPAAPVRKQLAPGPMADGPQPAQPVQPPPPPQQQQDPLQAIGSAARHPAAHTYEHYSRKWDRFDVDAALAEDEGEGSSGATPGIQQARQPSSGSAAPRSSGPSAPIAIPQARVTVPVGPSKAAASAGSGGAAPTSAEGWKDAGNAAFKRGQYREAVECYSRSLAVQPSCLAFANRAMAQLKLGQAAEAEADCSQALGLDPLYVKAYQRRATARRQLGQLLDAVDDCESALRLEPNNKQAAEDRAACVAALLKQEGLQPPSRSEWLPLVLSSSSGAGGSSSLTSDGAPAPSAVPVSASQPAAAPAESHEGDALISVAAVKRLKPAAAVAAAAAVAEVARVEPAADALPTASRQVTGEQSDVAAPVAGACSCEDVTNEAVSDAAKPEEAVPPVEHLRAAQPPPAPQQPQPAATPVVAAPSAAFKVPRTGLEFEKAWKGLKGDRQLQAAYLLALQPATLPALLRQALSPGLLAAAATALLDPGMQQQAAKAVELLESLAQVPRFDLNLLSVPPRQRAELAANWEAAAAAMQGQAGGDAAALTGRLAAVRQRYKL